MSTNQSDSFKGLGVELRLPGTEKSGQSLASEVCTAQRRKTPGRFLGWATPALRGSVPGCRAYALPATPSGVRHGGVGAGSTPQLRRIQKLGESRTLLAVATQLSAGFHRPRSALLPSWTAGCSPWPWSPRHLPRRFPVQPSRSSGELLALDLGAYPQLVPNYVRLLSFSFAGRGYLPLPGCSYFAASPIPVPPHLCPL